MKRGAIATTITVLTLFFLFIADFKPFVLTELKSLDLRFRLRGARRPPDQIVIVTIDEKSLDREGRWPWDREKIAKLIEKLSRSRAIGIDLGFFESSENDQKLASALKAVSKKAVLGYFLHIMPLPLGRKPHISEEEISKAQYSLIQIDEPPNPGTVIEAYAPELSVRSLTRNVAKLGYFNVFRDKDGTIRRYPLAIMWNGTALAPLAVQIAAIARSEESFIYIDRFGIEEVGIGEIGIPSTLKGMLFINYYGPPQSFKYISATDVLSGKVPEGFFEGKIVIIGATAMGLFDNHVSPFSNTYPGPEIHATVVANIMERNFLLPAPHLFYITLLLILIFSLSSMLSVWKGSLSAGMATTALLSAGYITAGILLFSKNIIINLTYPTLSLIVSNLVNSILKHQAETKEKGRLKSAFSHYLSPELVDEIIKDPNMLKLGGHKRRATVLFADIREFTAISESTDPEKLVSALNLHFDAMTQIILEHGGFVDKFIGDCIMAVFGVPIETEDHPTKAVLAAIRMVKKTREISKIWRENIGYPLKIGIGINTGEMLVGNIGSTRRLNYTVMGDSVNVASRLEGLCKLYGVNIIISETTASSVKNIPLRKLDCIKVKGKRKGLMIYEVPVDPLPQELIENFEKGLNLYMNGNWKEAANRFAKCLEIRPDDGPSQEFIKRCRKFIKNPPRNWNGIYTMESK